MRDCGLFLGFSRSPAWVLGLLLPLASVGWAGSGGLVSLPQPGRVFRRPSGLQLQISSYWVEASGYRPVQVEIISPGPSMADRTLTINLAPVNSYPFYDSQQIRFKLVLPQGAKRASRTVSVPQYSIWRKWTVEVYEDGRQLEDLCGDLSWPRTSQRWEWTEAFPAMLFVDRDAPNPGDSSWKLTSSLPGPEARRLPNIIVWARLISPELEANMARAAGRITPQGQMVFETAAPPILSDADPSDRDILTVLQGTTHAELRSLAALPDKWIDYTCFDLIVISLDDLAELSDQHPQAWGALRRYITAGGNLLVYGVGPKFEHLGSLQELLDGQPITEGARLLGGVDGWWLPKDQNFGQKVADQLRTGQYVQSFGPGGRIIAERIDADEEDLADASPKSVPEPLFCLRQLMLGRVVAIGPDDPFTNDGAQREWLLAELGQDRWQWYRRHGLSRQRVNNSFWDFLIPGVGAAPVTAFLFIITAFVVTIGPLNYWLLRKWKRLYLLLISVPLGAAVVTGCLLLYALTSDGLATRVRLRSFTEIDPSEGTAVSWTRQTYYAGLAPSGGLVFPRQTAVYAIDAKPARDRRRYYRLVWDDQQRLVAGYLPSRATSQFLVIHAGPTPLGLRIERDPDGTEVTVRNELQTEILELTVYGDGQVFWGEKLSAGQTVRLASVESSKAAGRIRLRMATERPTYPVGFDVSRPRRYYWGSNCDQSFPLPSLDSSLLELNLRMTDNAPLPPGRVYYAITKQAPPTVPVGVNGALQEAGFHVIKGKW